MQIGITTIDRMEFGPKEGSENYLEHTLESLFRPAGDIDVVLFDGGSTDKSFITACLDRWPSLTLVPTKGNSTTLMEDVDAALKYLVNASSDEWILYAQDDMIFMENTLTILPALIDMIPHDAGMVSFVTPYSFCDEGKNMFVPYPVDMFYHIGLMAFRKSLLQQWFESREHRNAMYFKNRADLFIGKWFGAVSKIYAFDPNLGRHIGEASANGHTEIFAADYERFFNAPFYGENYNASGIIEAMTV